MEIYYILILASLLFLIYLFYVLTSDYYSKSYCKKNNSDNSHIVEYINYENNLNYENFTKDYYSYNWTSPTLIKDINEDTLDIGKKICRCSDCGKINKNIKKVSYSMSCDLTDDSSNPNCFEGYDIPINNRNHTI
jgi:hypothetical protein